MMRAIPSRFSGLFRPFLMALPAMGSGVFGACGGDNAQMASDTGVADSGPDTGGEVTVADDSDGDSALADIDMVVPELPAIDAADHELSSHDPEVAPPLLFPDSDRAVPIRYPDDFTSNDSDRPLVVLLHGFGASGAIQDAYLGLAAVATKRGWLVAIPDGTTNRAGSRFWNAAPSWCCDFDNSGVDDTAWLAGLVAEALQRLPVDPARVYLVGHSNGGYMAHRMACAHGDLVAGIVSIAGGLPARVNACAPAKPIAMIQVHGTFDSVVYFQGQFGLYPSAREVGDRWSSYNQCDTAAPAEEAARRNFDTAMLGDETRILTWSGCPREAGVELWQMDGSQHVPVFDGTFLPSLLDRLETLSGYPVAD